MDVTAHASRSGGWWAISVPEVPGLFTQVRRLDQVVATVRDAAESFDVETVTTVRQWRSERPVEVDPRHLP
ncbi:hypothetical protein [Nocardia sp. NPDC058666]|uniref:hypothetical protein n=1 Tax=unclassified Nocardia TaxID=2637762 RepID=UPI003660E1FC